MTLPVLLDLEEQKIHLRRRCTPSQVYWAVFQGYGEHLRKLNMEFPLLAVGPRDIRIRPGWVVANPELYESAG